MTTLEQIGFTLAGGTSILCVSMTLFGFAMKYRSIFIAPRATARPADVIYNPNPQFHTQDRGNPWTGWIGWTLSLTYDTLLNGIPGTGTREGGMSGSLLKVNLDGIVMLRFHAVCMRVAGLASILFIIIGVPIYLSAQCYTRAEYEEGDGCGTNAYNLTNYQRTTMANVPAIEDLKPLQTVIDQHDGILWRLYTIVGCFWIVAMYLCSQLHQEWIQILAIRRVYYLEYDVWGERRKELKQTLLYEEIAAKKREKLLKEQQRQQQQENYDDNSLNGEKKPHKRQNIEHESALSTDRSRYNPKKKGKHFTFDSNKKDNNAESSANLAAVAALQQEPHLTNREPWIPHPEQRDTVPNIALYSILVGGLPSLPEQAADSFNTEQTIQFSKRESIDWQLSLTTAFFDHCVPNQPGFSSSVAAVTIIPGAMDLSLAWRKWYAAASKLRRLRFIREQIAIRRHFDIETPNSNNDENIEDDIEKYGYGDDDDDNNNNDNQFKDEGDNTVDYGYGDDEVYVPIDASDEDISSYIADMPKRPMAKKDYRSWDHRDETPRGIYEEPSLNQAYYKQVLGAALGNEHDTHIYDSLEFGPEQASIYAREFAQSAAPCCPNGFNEGRVKRATIDQLVEMERIVAVEVHQANLELREARQRATRADSSMFETNIHDAQRGQDVHHDNHPPTGHKNRSMIQGVNTRPFQQQPSTIDEDEESDEESDEEEEDDDDVIVPLQSQPMPSRYDRRASSNNDNGNSNNEVVDKRASLMERVQSTRLQVEGLGGDSMDLGLETQLFRKSKFDAASTRNLGGLNNNVSTTKRGSLNAAGTERRGSTGRREAMSTTVSTAVPPSSSNRRGSTGRREAMSTTTSTAVPTTNRRGSTGRREAMSSTATVNTDVPSRRGSTGRREAMSSSNVEISPLQRAKTTGATFPVSTPVLPVTDDNIEPATLARSKSADEPGSSSKKKKNRDAPNLEGITLPRNISLEANLMLESSHHSSGSNIQRRNGKQVKRDKFPEEDDIEGKRKYFQQGKAKQQGLGKHQHDDFSFAYSDYDPSGKRKNYFMDGTTSCQWNQVETIITEARDSGSGKPPTPRPVDTGRWECPDFRSLFHRTTEQGKNIHKFVEKQTKDAIEDLARESTYAVVTFTSRQAAVAARTCLADGRAAGRWVTLKELPIPPLADAAPGDIMTFRNCCRPVTLSIPQRQKNCRHYICLAVLAVLYIFYTIPLTLASQLVDIDTIDRLIPKTEELSGDKRVEIALLLSGLVSAGIWCCFFALCPGIFKAIAHFGSNSTSVAEAEFKALQYYWWFMVMTAFSGQLLANMGLKAVNEGLSVESEFQSVLRQIALAIPSTVSVSWLNWIIFRWTIVIPLSYMLQVNTFLFYLFGMNCCSRLVRGGGPGGPVPYRIYIDSGVVLMCVLALAPASPLVAPAAFIYFLFCQPMLRQNLIFMYRPKFDGGGFRWPFIFDMCISGLIVGEILLTVQMALKQAAGPAAAAAFAFIPTYLFSKATKERFMRSFQDAALLQTSLLDGWDTSVEYTARQREEFRQFLVDAHKAAYVPICLAGTDTDEFLTAQPAVVIQEDVDDIEDIADFNGSIGFSGDSHDIERGHGEIPQTPVTPFADKRTTQHGVTLRRAVKKISALRNRTSSMGSGLYDSLNEEDKFGLSPFDRSMSYRNLETGSSRDLFLSSRSVVDSSKDSSQARFASMRSVSNSTSRRNRLGSDGKAWKSTGSIMMEDIMGDLQDLSEGSDDDGAQID